VRLFIENKLRKEFILAGQFRIGFEIITAMPGMESEK